MILQFIIIPITALRDRIDFFELQAQILLKNVQN